jgi:UDP-glucose 4-epimerase
MKPNGILIIGGTGFIGAALAKRLAQEHRPIHVLARHAGRQQDRHIFMHRGSIDDAVLLRNILPHCSTIIHAASTTTPGVSAQQPSLEAMQNILPTLRFLEVLREFKNRHLIFFSSGGTLYGNPQHVPVEENQPLAPLSYYGAGKAAIEAFLHTFGAQGDCAISILRPSNIYGAEQPFRPGFGIIRTMLDHIMQNSQMEIWGDGEIIRDFIYIDDVLDVCLKLVDASEDSGIYNLGSDRGYSLNHVKKTIEAICQAKLDVRYRPARQIDVKNIVLNTSLLRNRFNWQPRIALEEGIALTWAWLNT